MKVGVVGLLCRALLLGVLPAGCGSAPKGEARNPPAAELRFDPDEGYVRGDKLDEAIHAWMKERHVPGLAAGVVLDGRVMKVRGYGLADVREGVAVGPDTAFFIGSLSKSFAAIGVMMLVEEGRVGIEDPVSKYLHRTPRAWRGITVRDLLAHTSGIPDYINKSMVVQDSMLFGIPITGHYLNGDFRHDMKGEWLAGVLGEQPLEFAPGTRYAYSNSNYLLLGMVIRKVTGRPYGVFLRERIFEPLGMTRTRVYGDGAALADCAVGYRWDGGRLVEERSRMTVDGMGPGSGGMLTTVADLVKWDAALSEGRMVSRATLREMWKQGRLRDGTAYPYGLGFTVCDMPGGGTVVGHSGAVPGYTSAFFRYRERLTIIYLANLDHLDGGSTPTEFWDAYLPPGPAAGAGSK